MTRPEAILFARRELADGADLIDVIGELEVRGFTSLEAEELAEEANFDLRNEHE